MVFVLGIVGRAVTFIFGGLILGAPGAFYAHQHTLDRVHEGTSQHSRVWAAADLREIAKGGAMKMLVNAFVRSHALENFSHEDQLDVYPLKVLREAMLLAAAGTSNRVDKKLTSFASTYEPASTCAVTGSAGNDGLVICKAGCNVKTHMFDLFKPHPGACHILCAVAVEPCGEPWATLLPVTWEAWDRIKIAGYDLRNMLLAVMCAIEIFRENARRRDAANDGPEGDDNRADGSQESGSESGDRSTSSEADETEGVGGSNGGGDSGVRDAFVDMRRRLAAAENAMADMQGQIAAEREQMQSDMDATFNMLLDPREAS